MCKSSRGPDFILTLIFARLSATIDGYESCNENQLRYDNNGLRSLGHSETFSESSDL